MVFILTALRRLGRGAFSRLFEAVFFVGLISWDFSLVVINTLTFKRKIGQVTPKGRPGEGGVWPEYIPPREGDSRCSCPALNAMANHGIISRDGRNIPFKEISRLARSTFNFSPTFCLYVPRLIAHILNRSYSSGHMDLSDIDVHNGLEHDASLVRRETYLQFHQGTPDPELIAMLLKSATGPPPKRDTYSSSQGDVPDESPYSHVATHVATALSDFDMNRTLTAADMSRQLGRRRSEAPRINPQFSLATSLKMIGSANATTLLTIFGGRVGDLSTFLTEERFPPGWESCVRDQMGLTMISLNLRALGIELGIEEENALSGSKSDTRAPSEPTHLLDAVQGMLIVFGGLEDWPHHAWHFSAAS